jgi:hypothetical protein
MRGLLWLLLLVLWWLLLLLLLLVVLVLVVLLLLLLVVVMMCGEAALLFAAGVVLLLPQGGVWRHPEVTQQAESVSTTGSYTDCLILVHAREPPRVLLQHCPAHLPTWWCPPAV